MSTDKESKIPGNSSGYAKAARFMGIGIQLGVTIYLGTLLGEWLDEHHGKENVNWKTICTLIGVFAGLTSTIIQVIRVTNQDEK